MKRTKFLGSLLLIIFSTLQCAIIANYLITLKEISFITVVAVITIIAFSTFVGDIIVRKYFNR